MEFSKKDTLMIKGIAIIMMYFHHNFLRMSRFEKYTIVSWPFEDLTIYSIARFCKICVALFLFLSAYGMTIGYKKYAKDYMVSVTDIYQVTIKRFFSMMFGYWFIFAGTQIAAFFIDPVRQKDIYGSGIDAVIHVILDFFGLTELLGIDAFIDTWWYMGLAIVLILIMPLLLRVYSRVGVLIIPLAFLLPRILKMDTSSDLIRWLFTAALGIWCADQNILVKIKKWSLCKNEKLSALIKGMAEILILLCLYKARKSEVGNEYLELIDGLGAFFIIIFSFEFIAALKWIREILAFLGKHSMNMFLTHTVFRAIWFDEYIYAFKYVGLIMLALLAVTVILSILIEQLKKWLQYGRLEKNIITECQKMIRQEEKG